MEIIHNMPAVSPEACAASIGFFDGVHAGHRFLIEQVRETAKTQGLRSAVITFPVHPRKVMNSYYKPDLLTTYEEKINLLAQTGIDYCFVLDFTSQISHLSAFEFMQTVLKDQFNVRSLVIGHDHRFGYNRSESFDNYHHFGKVLGMNIIRAHACSLHEEVISSSVIRRLLLEGEVKKAADYLGYTYCLNGIVTGGYKVGRSIGYPTANLHMEDPEKLIPTDGVYAVWVEVENEKHAGMLNIGYRPTFNGQDRSIEVHIFNFSKDIYHTPLRLHFVEFVRSEMRFNNKQELVEQLDKDADTVQSILKIKK